MTQNPSSDTDLPPRVAAEHAHTAIEFLRARRRELVRAILLGFLVSTIIAFLIPNRYEATTSLMPPDQGNSTAAMLGSLTAKSGELLGAVAADSLGLRTQGATIVGVLNSRTIQDDIIDKFDLRKIYWTKRYESARRILQRRTSIYEDRKSGIITISVQDRDPTRAAQMARAYVDYLNLRITKLTTSAARREREFLEARLQTIKRQLDETTSQLSTFSSHNRTFDPQIQGKAMIEAASTLQGQLIAAEAELTGLEQIYGPENSRVKAAGGRIAELRLKLRTMGGTGSRSQPGRELYPSLEELPLLGNTYYDLARQAKITEAVYEALTKQYELARVQEAKEIPSIRVLDEPVPPERKVWPPRAAFMFFGTLLTLAVTVIYLLTKENLSELVEQLWGVGTRS